MELYLVAILFIVSFAWNIASYLIKEGLYYTSPFSAIFIKSLVFFLVSLSMLLFLIANGKKININKSKKALRYFVIAVGLTFFVGTLSFVFLLKDVEKISMTLFIKSVSTLLLVSIFSYMFLGERLNIRQISGIIIGITGVGLIIFNTDLHKKIN